MKVIDWLNDIINDGLLCEEYTKRVRGAFGKKSLFEIVCDANGVSFIPEMAQKGHPLDYDIIKEEFGKYINGKYKPKYVCQNGIYTSSLYCEPIESFEVDTTLTCILGIKSSCHVNVKEYNYAKIYLDTNSHLSLDMPEHARCTVYCYGDANVDVDGFKENVKVKFVRDEK